MITPRTTILIADLAADCFKVIPRKAPMKDRRKTPISIDAETEYVCEKKTKGSRRARDARDEVDEVTSPETKARRCTFARRL
jgi:hypothetical protein